MQTIFSYNQNYDDKLLLRKVSEVAGDENTTLVIFKGNENQAFIKSVESRLGKKFLKIEGGYGVFKKEI